MTARRPRSATAAAHLIGAVRDALGVRVLALWGMTENGGVTFQKYVLQDQLRELRARGQ